VPGLLVGFGLMIYSHFFGPVGLKRKRASLCQFADAAKASALPLMIPTIILGGILSGWFTPTEAGLIAVAYIVFVLIPLINPPAHPQPAARFRQCRAALAAVAAASAFGWMLAYLRGPDVVACWIQQVGGTDPRTIIFLLVALFVIVGDFIDAVPAIIIFMPIINALTELGQINPVHMGVVIIVTLAFGLITPPYGLSLEIRRCRFHAVGDPLAAALHRVLRRDRILHLLPGRGAVDSEKAAAGIRRLLQKPERHRLHLPASVSI
jgi:C4-dicarboxylate transporter, DctM subunit